MRKEYIQSAKTELERFQKQGDTAANSTLPSNEPTKRAIAATRPLKRKKATSFFELSICLIYLTVDVIYPECVNTL